MNKPSFFPDSESHFVGNEAYGCGIGFDVGASEGLRMEDCKSTACDIHIQGDGKLIADIRGNFSELRVYGNDEIVQVALEIAQKPISHRKHFLKQIWGQTVGLLSDKRFQDLVLLLVKLAVKLNSGDDG